MYGTLITVADRMLIPKAEISVARHSHRPVLFITTGPTAGYDIDR